MQPRTGIFALLLLACLCGAVGWSSHRLDDDVRGIVSQLLILETRPDWIDWLGELLALGKFPSEAEESNTARNASDQGESDKGTSNQSDSDESSPVELLPPGNAPEPDGDDA